MSDYLIHSSNHLLADSQVELLSGIDALYLSARGTAPDSLLAELDGLRNEAEAGGLPVDANLGGYPGKVQPRAWGKYRYCASHELALLGLTPSDVLPVVRIQPTAVA